MVRVSVRRPLSDGIYVQGEEIMRAAGATAKPVALLAGIGSLRGAHNAQNAACATAAALALGLEPRAIQQGLWSFPGLAHRMEEIGRKGASCSSTTRRRPMRTRRRRRWPASSNIFWIAGGKPKTGGITPLAEFFPRIAKAYLIGEAAEEFAATLAGKVRAACVAGTLERAVAAAARDAEASGLAAPVVLLSPACASFDSIRTSRCAATGSASWSAPIRAYRRGEPRRKRAPVVLTSRHSAVLFSSAEFSGRAAADTRGARCGGSRM